VYEIPTYEDLTKVLESYLKEGKSGQSDDDINSEEDTDNIENSSVPESQTNKNSDSTTATQVTSQPPNSETKDSVSSNVVSPTAKKSMSETNIEDLSKAFDNLFNN
jgi:hypothetical protein